MDSMSSILEYRWSDLPEVGNILGTSKFSKALRQGWDRARAAGALRYNVKELPTRFLSGAHSYLLQLNPARATKRRAAALIRCIQQDFDPDAFNFTRVQPSEVVLRLRSRDRGEDIHSVLVNASPISELHSLFCPYLELCLPQVVTADNLTLAVELYFLAGDRNLRIGFNSLCALASVNHLHYHLLVEGATLPIEQVACKHLIGPLYCFEEFPVPGFCFQIATKQSIAHVCADAYKLIRHFLEKNIAHNLMITRGISLDSGNCEVLRIVIWPRRSSCEAKQYDAFNVALCELSGWFPIYDEDHFKNLDHSDIEKELNKWRIDSFENLKESAKSLYQ